MKQQKIFELSYFVYDDRRVEYFNNFVALSKKYKMLKDTPWYYTDVRIKVYH